jgi:hypothetical protein
MEKRDEEFIISLLDKDADLKRCYLQHQELEEKLLDYQQKSHLTAAEEIDKKRIQKLKLAAKDKIMEIVSRHRHGTLHGETE